MFTFRAEYSAGRKHAQFKAEHYEVEELDGYKRVLVNPGDNQWSFNVGEGKAFRVVYVMDAGKTVDTIR